MSESLVLRATRTYAPSHWEDGQKSFAQPIDFTIPSWVPVVLGNGGNHWLELRFRTPTGEEHNCDYRAGSDKAHPETLVEQAKGRRYLFVRCSNELKPGDVTRALSFLLHIRNGDHKDPATITQVELRLGGNLPELAPPISPEESVAIRDAFSWANTSALPEQNTEGLPSLYYTLIYVEEREQIDALDEMLVHYSTLPLFGEELDRWQGQRGLFAHEGDGRGLFLFALMPASIYNLLRTAALEGNDIYSVIALREVPASAKLGDGSVSYEALRRSGFLYRNLQPEDVATWAQASPGMGQAKQELFNKLKRAIVKAIATVAKAVVRTIVRGIGAVDRWIGGSVNLRVRLDLRNIDPNFQQGPMQRAWGAGAGSQVTLPGVRVSAWQRTLGGVLPTLYTGHTDATGTAQLRITRGKNTSLCVAIENRGAEVTRFLVEIEACDFAAPLPGSRLQTHTNLNIPVRHRLFNVLAQASEGWAYMNEIVGHSPRRAVILVGGLANLMGRFQPGVAMAPCFGFPNLAYDAFVNVLALEASKIPIVGPVVSAAIRQAGPAYAVDMIIADDPSEFLPGVDRNFDSRGLVSHEYGHFALCSMMYAEGFGNITVGYTDAILERISNGGNPTPNNEAAYINEGFADFMAGQLVGGVGYFMPPNTRVSLGTNYCSASSNDCLEVNCGPPGAPNECRSSRPSETDFDRQVGRITTLLHDAFDGRPSLPPLNAPGNGDVWTWDSSNLLGYSSVRNGSNSDERVALPGASISRTIKHWDRRGSKLTQDTFLGGLSDAMEEAGVNWCDRCRVFALHDARWDPNNSIEPLCQSSPIRDWIGSGNCSSGTWTSWLDRDIPSGTGDWETLVEFVNAGQACPNPIDIQCQTVDGIDWTQTGQVYTCNASWGGICVNDDQPNGTCLDYRVRFLCP
jgi:hypothetical protein